jgi:putative ABC transport system permease protein
LIKDQYDLVYGQWPQEPNQLVLVVNDKNELSDMILCTLGLVSTDKIVEEMKASQKGEDMDTTVYSWSYEDICNKEFKAFLPIDFYMESPSGGYTDLTKTEKGAEYLYGSDKGMTLKISGIIRLNDDATAGMLSSSLGYTSALTNEMLAKIERNQGDENGILHKQIATPQKDVLLNLEFLPEDFVDYSDEEKSRLIREYLSGLSQKEKAERYIDIASIPSQEYLDMTIQGTLGNLSREELISFVKSFLAEQEAEGTDVEYIDKYLDQLSDQELFDQVEDAMAEQLTEQYKEQVKKSLANVPQAQLAMMLDAALLAPEQYTLAQWVTYYEEFMPPVYSESTYEENLELLGFVQKESPSSINIYTSTFENKDKVADLIKQYNETKEEEDKIKYTDVVGIMMSGISTIINAISYVLVAFVSISLIVSSIMIGIITYISVLERTKEIGILRAIGASKKDVSRVFNAESTIVGFAAGVIGIGITLLLNIPINIIIHNLTEIYSLNSSLPPMGYVLILISVLLSFIAGLMPSRFAAKKDPVEALRTE